MRDVECYSSKEAEQRGAAGVLSALFFARSRRESASYCCFSQVQSDEIIRCSLTSTPSHTHYMSVRRVLYPAVRSSNMPTCLSHVTPYKSIFRHTLVREENTVTSMARRHADAALLAPAQPVRLRHAGVAVLRYELRDDVAENTDVYRRIRYAIGHQAAAQGEIRRDTFLLPQYRLCGIRLISRWLAVACMPTVRLKAIVPPSWRC